jgi:hypothetical protein
MLFPRTKGGYEHGLCDDAAVSKSGCTTCPRCGEEYEELSGKEISCSACGTVFRRIEELANEYREQDEPRPANFVDPLGAKETLEDHVEGPLKPLGKRKRGDDNSQTDMRKFRRIQLISRPIILDRRDEQNLYTKTKYPQRRPNLSEILANKARLPWTLSAFMAYISQNQCLETLEFTMDASRYRKNYSKIVNRTQGSPISPLSDECTYGRMLWKRLLDAYIMPTGPREVNLPTDIRESLLSLYNADVPPHPSTLDEAVYKIYELMEESILIPSLNSVSEQSPTFDNFRRKPPAVPFVLPLTFGLPTTVYPELDERIT